MTTPSDHSFYYDPSDDECPHCGGEGVVFECFDGCCEDCDIGCDQCTRACSCSPNKVRDTGDELGTVLAEALNSSKPDTKEG